MLAKVNIINYPLYIKVLHETANKMCAIASNAKRETRSASLRMREAGSAKCKASFYTRTLI